MISSIVQTEALVLRNLRFGDTSRVATILTRDLGKLGVLGKGVRDPKSPFGGSLEVLSHSTFVLYYRQGRELQFLKSGALEREFRGLLREPRRFLWASACAEFLDRLLTEEEPSAELFALALRAMEVMEQSPLASLGELFRAWQLRVASLLGYAPRLDACMVCGRVSPGPGEESASWVFLPAEGAAACPECAAARGLRGIKLSPRGLRRIRAMLKGGRATGGRQGETAGLVREPSPLWLNTLDRFVEEFLRYHVGAYRGLRSLEGRLSWDRPDAPFSGNPARIDEGNA